MEIVNNATQELIESLKNENVTISMTHAAKLLGLSNPKQLIPAADRGELPFVVRINYPTRASEKYLVITMRFIKYLLGELDKDNKKEGTL